MQIAEWNNSYLFVQSSPGDLKSASVFVFQSSFCNLKSSIDQVSEPAEARGSFVAVP